ncbi:MAG: histidinol dehydrogenase [Armatimonadota bacterium]|nr:histidinol dehydrogenase [bacterium]
MRILETDRDPKEMILAALKPAESGDNTELEMIVREIIADVRSRGDQALLDYGRKFDSPQLDHIQPTDAEFDEAYSSISQDLLAAIRMAKANIEEFHRNQVRKSWIDMRDDITYGQIVRPIERVGIYAPSRLAPLPSTVLMTAVPARVAGVGEIILCAPPQDDGKINSAMLVAARECGVDKVYAVGGAPAAAAMAYGTETVPRVDKIFGPGNAFFVEAKRQLFGVVGIDQLAGPSEILVLADDSANPVYVAADILSQAEHAEDSRCVMVTNSRQLADAALKEVRAQTESAARRDFVKKSLDSFGVIVITRDMEEAVDLANEFAPEHLEIVTRSPWETLKRVKNAGTIMLGNYTPVPLCDYAAGPNHTLPTAGTARFSSALSVDDFVKKSGLLSYSQDALHKIAPTVIEMASAEGLDAHANTIRLRTR